MPIAFTCIPGSSASGPSTGSGELVAVIRMSAPAAAAAAVSTLRASRPSSARARAASASRRCGEREYTVTDSSPGSSSLWARRLCQASTPVPTSPRRRESGRASASAAIAAPATVRTAVT